jgi:hypothetical protein
MRKTVLFLIFSSLIIAASGCFKNRDNTSIPSNAHNAKAIYINGQSTTITTTIMSASAETRYFRADIGSTNIFWTNLVVVAFTNVNFKDTASIYSNTPTTCTWSPMATSGVVRIIINLQASNNNQRIWLYKNALPVEFGTIYTSIQVANYTYVDSVPPNIADYYQMVLTNYSPVGGSTWSASAGTNNWWFGEVL